MMSIKPTGITKETELLLVKTKGAQTNILGSHISQHHFLTKEGLVVGHCSMHKMRSYV